MNSIVGIYRVFLRYVAVFRKNIIYATVTMLAEPFLYLASFGFGLGGMIGDIRIGNLTVSYRSFVLGGIVAQTILFQSFFEASYGGFVRMYYQRIFQAISVTPVTLSEVLWGELVWNAFRTLLSAAAVLAIGVAIGDFSFLGAILLLPFCFATAFIFAALGLLVAAKSKTIETISYPQYLLVFPMFLFCGVFYPITSLPEPVRVLASWLPLTPVVSIIRTAVLGFPFEPFGILVLVFCGVILVPWSRRAMTKRLIA